MADEEDSTSHSNDDIEKHRLWIGNIDKRLSEFNLLKIFQGFGQVKHFDYLFHTSGPHRGEPRGYCFVEYSNKQESLKAFRGLNGKMALSRALVVHWAKDDQSQTRTKEKMAIKAVEDKAHRSSVSHDSKIQAIEAKLKLMESSSYTSDNLTTHASKHPLLQESERNKNIKPYTTKAKKSTWKVFNKPR